MLLPVTLVIAGACAIINLWLAIRLVRGRVTGKVMMGDGGVPTMVSGMRAHANFTEYAPILLILIALIELARGPSPYLWALGFVFVLARIAHPFGMDREGPNPFRAGGAMGTWAVTAILAGWALVIAYQAEVKQPTIEEVPVEVVPSA
ncbi:MAPEG family protein [Sphingomonas sp. SUN019]|uniref:MAPEG family protein n=1 Tax=Sphingomonas sp. SUN019 TaxID=2937788 RepID=UPI0021648317|nr:MAPEG family protein [Sphingomonas sp. SUN019]UVO51316.1 MAPEG family protein [Sphingomonas sp. SUN019]